MAANNDVFRPIKPNGKIMQVKSLGQCKDLQKAGYTKFFMSALYNHGHFNHYEEYPLSCNSEERLHYDSDYMMDMESLIKNDTVSEDSIFEVIWLDNTRRTKAFDFKYVNKYLSCGSFTQGNNAVLTNVKKIGVKGNGKPSREEFDMIFDEEGNFKLEIEANGGWRYAIPVQKIVAHYRNLNREEINYGHGSDTAVVEHVRDPTFILYVNRPNSNNHRNQGMSFNLYCYNG